MTSLISGHHKFFIFQSSLVARLKFVSEHEGLKCAKKTWKRLKDIASRLCQIIWENSGILKETLYFKTQDKNYINSTFTPIFNGEL